MRGWIGCAERSTQERRSSYDITRGIPKPHHHVPLVASKTSLSNRFCTMRRNPGCSPGRESGDLDRFVLARAEDMLQFSRRQCVL